MKKTISEFSESDWNESFGELSPEEREAMISEGEGDAVAFDPTRESVIHRGLVTLGSAVRTSGETVPPMPANLKSTLMAEVESSVQARRDEEASLIRGAEGQDRPVEVVAKTPPFWSRLKLLALAGAAAVLVCGVVALFLDEGSSSVPMAGGATILTPGEVTGFQAPIFTWKADNGGAVDVEVADARTGRKIASLGGAFSPVSFEKFEIQSPLVPGQTYRVTVSGGRKGLAETTFRISSEAVAGGPVRENTLEGVIRQCEDLIEQGRPADAWMLWAKLSSDEKQDERMQRLREIILERIG